MSETIQTEPVASARDEIPAPRASTSAADTFRPAVLIPAYNHAESLHSVITALQIALEATNESAPILIVNDGSTDDTPQLLQSIPGITILTHPKNRGKGAALRTGFLHAQSAGFTHVITVDADGQHDTADVFKILAAARAHPEALTIGERDMDRAEVPRASRKGRDMSRFGLRLQTGLDLPDSQCGLRAYPVNIVLAVPQRFTRYDYETEILARLAWGGVAIRPVPIRCIYFPPEKRITHFRLIVDTLRAIRVHVFLVSRRLAPIPFRRLIPLKETDPQRQFRNWWKWATWRAAMSEVLRANASNRELALSFAMGVFFGIAPFFMFQTILAIYFSRRLHLNVLAALIGSQISVPPLAFFWIGLSIYVGRFLAEGWVWPYLLGSVVLASSVGMLSLFVSRGLLYCLRSERV